MVTSWVTEGQKGGEQAKRKEVPEESE
jgi:hypothetical protein